MKKELLVPWGQHFVRWDSEKKERITRVGPLNYASAFEKSLEWRPNTIFWARLKFIGIQQGRSRVNGLFEDTTGTRYNVFLRDFEALIPQLDRGLIEGTWTFAKRGANYGLTLVRLGPEDTVTGSSEGLV